MLGITELYELEEQLRAALSDQLEEIIIRLNRTDKLEEFLDLIGMKAMLGCSKVDTCNRDGIIIVIGQSDVEKTKLAAVAKEFGFGKDRFEFHLDYEDAKTFDFSKTQWSTKYACILVGPMPHSGKAKGDYSSIIAALKQTDGYPPIIEMGNNGLNISKTSFRNSLTMAMNELNIAA